MATIKVNGKARSVDVLPNKPLLWVLRDDIGLKGTKYGCGRGLCGACTVHVDGVAVRSCVTELDSVVDKEVVTIEGLGDAGDLGLFEAWRELDVSQCGYCQPGQIMQAASLLRSHERPSDSEIDAAMAGNICRCGTYVRIRAAIRRASGS